MFYAYPHFTSVKNIEDIHMMHGFIFRFFSEFYLLSPLKALYCARICIVLEYSSILWGHSTSSTSAIVERFRTKFLHIAVHNLNLPHSPHDYTPVLYALNIFTLADHRYSFNLPLLSNLISAKIDYLTLLSHVSFRVPAYYSLVCLFPYSSRFFSFP